MPNNTIIKGNFNAQTSLLNRPLFLTLVVFFLAIKLILSLFWPSDQKPIASSLSPDNILNAVNKERSLRNLVNLNTNNKLSYAAQSKSDDMQSRHYFAHVDPDGHYIWDKIIAAGYSPYLQLGENLAIEFYDTESLMSAWMNSPTHRANIIQEGFRDQGIGLAFGDSQKGQYHTAITNTFGAQATALPKPKITPPTPAPTATPTPAPAKTQAPPTKTLSPVAPPLPEPETTKTTPTTTSYAPISPRAEQTLAGNQKTEPNFTLKQTPGTTASTTRASSTPDLPFQENFSGLVGQTGKANLGNYNFNRFLILICGVILLLLMLSDLKTAVEKKLGSLDKKINNLAVLLISIVIIAFMYWL